ncbi:MAG: hypothetical protein LBM96_03395 [Methanobrevibacter sp.]|jgi:hypothetical protein|nr:hypothetical protein [Candidatus Methanoflexus mossambicus]
MKKNFKFMIIIIFIIILIFALIISFIGLNEDNVNSKLLNENSLGSVYLYGPYGNVDSTNKIAFIIGVHPLENNSHRAVLNVLNDKNRVLNNSYYVYFVNVTKDSGNFDKSRLNGQLLAQEFIVPDIISKNYSMVVDFHSNRGVYVEETFLLAPLNEKESFDIGNNIVKDLNNFKMLKFVPATDGHPTSPDYVSIPILKNGTNSLIFETIIKQSDNKTYNLVNSFILKLDEVMS